MPATFVSPEAAGNFFDELSKAFGFDDAHKIGSVIVGSIAGAHTRLPLLRSLQHIRASVLETNGLDGFANDDRISINVSPSMSTEEVISRVPLVIEHEIAHVAHRQHSPGFQTSVSSPREYLLAGAFKEGIATHAEYSLDTSYSAQIYQQHSWIGIRQQNVYAALERLDGIKADTTQQYYNFLFGEVGLPADGYQIGTYAITKIVAEHGLTDEELMKAPFADLELLFETAA